MTTQFREQVLVKLMKSFGNNWIFFRLCVIFIMPQFSQANELSDLLAGNRGMNGKIPEIAFVEISIVWLRRKCIVLGNTEPKSINNNLRIIYYGIDVRCSTAPAPT